MTNLSDRQKIVIERICAAIDTGRKRKDPQDYSFPADCFCVGERPGWEFQFSENFLIGLEAAIAKFSEEYTP